MRYRSTGSLFHLRGTDCRDRPGALLGTEKDIAEVLGSHYWRKMIKISFRSRSFNAHEYSISYICVGGMWSFTACMIF